MRVPPCPFSTRRVQDTLAAPACHALKDSLHVRVQFFALLQDLPEHRGPFCCSLLTLPQESSPKIATTVAVAVRALTLQGMVGKCASGHASHILGAVALSCTQCNG